MPSDKLDMYSKLSSISTEQDYRPYISADPNSRIHICSNCLSCRSLDSDSIIYVKASTMRWSEEFSLVDSGSMIQNDSSLDSEIFRRYDFMHLHGNELVCLFLHAGCVICSLCYIRCTRLFKNRSISYVF